jgi:hypothetical protein
VQRVPTVGQGCQRGTAWTGLENKRWGGIDCSSIAGKSIRALYTAGFKGGHAFKRPAPVRLSPRHKLGQNRTFTLGVPGCSPGAAIVILSTPTSPTGVPRG